MKIVLLVAFGVGGATVVGAIIGFLAHKASKILSHIAFYLSSVIMLVSAIFGLIIPAYEYGKKGFFTGLILGVLTLLFVDIFISKIDKNTHLENEEKSNHSFKRAMLFIIAISIHNFPEGMAAGVGFGGDMSRAVFTAVGIAVQNLPEGMVVISPMLNAGISKKKTFLLSLFTGSVEVLGTCFGYFAVSMSNVIMPYVLSFAGGNMLYLVFCEIYERIRK